MKIIRFISFVGAILILIGATTSSAVDRLGGDGTLLGFPEGSYSEDMDIASNGDIYIALVYEHPTDGDAIAVHRSTDGGATFTQWGIISSPGTSVVFQQPKLIIAEGAEDRCFVAFTSNNTPGDDTVVVAWEDLSSPTAGFAARSTVFAQAGDSFETPDLAADDNLFSGYFLYLVGVGKDGNGHDIWFGRSTDQGSTWESAYEIAASPSAVADFRRPSISHGIGSHVHVAWEYASPTQAFPSAIRYIRADNDAADGLIGWGLVWFVTSTTNGFFDTRAKIVAAHDSQDVVLVYSKLYLNGEDLFLGPPAGKISNVQGNLGFSASAEISITNGSSGGYLFDLCRSPVSGDWYANFDTGGLQIFKANFETPSIWSDHGRFDPQHQVSMVHVYGGSIAIDPSHGNRVALVVRSIATTDRAEAIFLAEWQADPGHPITADGFPVDLQAPPISDPALVDLNGNGDLEIIFGDEAGNIRAIQADGTELPGWPVAVGSLSDSPIACGKLTLGDEIFVVAGTADGRVYALMADGSVAPGWPIDFDTSAPAHVSLGALGGPFPLTIVVASGTLLTFRDFAGRWPENALERINPFGEANYPCAIGDIDNDGMAEVVIANSSLVLAFERDTIGDEFGRGFPTAVSGPITMGDIDLDGDLEIAVPTEDGLMYLIDHTGADLPGWPFNSGLDMPMRSAAWANVLGTDEPELALATKAWKLHLLSGDGVQQAGFPVNAGLGWFQYGSPVIAQIDGLFPDILIGSDGSEGWVFNVIGNEVEGWPRQLDASCRWTPAVGDMDQDGFNEVVLLTNDNVQVFDVRSAPLPPELSWTMAGHDPQRTGCSDCDEDLISPVDDPSSRAPVRVSFAPPHPNPASARTTLSYSLPSAAQVRLQIFDVRGHLVRTLTDGQKEAGHHVAFWNGAADNGRRVALGLYLAKLAVSGPGVQEERVRKISLVR